MNITQTLLKNLSGGELQKLGENLLKKINKWEHLSHYGGNEGGHRTRKGQPDLWAVDKNKIVYMSATGDASKGKLYGDIKKSVEKFLSLDIDSKLEKLCVAFLNYDPDSEEVIQCINYCYKNQIKFQYYTNNDIAELLDNEYQDLRESFLEIKIDNNKLSLVVHEGGIITYKKIDALLSQIVWMNLTEQVDTSALIKELIANAFKYGIATKFEVFITSNTISIQDDGQAFNLLEFSGKSENGFNGGKDTLNAFKENYSWIDITYRRKNNPELNIYTLKNNKLDKRVLRVGKHCKLEIDDLHQEVQRIDVPQKCTTITITIDPHLFFMSNIRRLEYLLNTLLIKDEFKELDIELIIPKNRGILLENPLKNFTVDKKNIRIIEN